MKQVKQYFTNKAAEVAAYFQAYATGAEATNSNIEFTNVEAESARLRTRMQSHQAASKAQTVAVEKLDAQIADLNSKVSDEAVSIEGKFAYAKAQAYVLPYNVAVCIKSIPSKVALKGSQCMEYAKAHPYKAAGYVLAAVATCAALVVGLVSAYRNKDAVISVCSDVLSKMLEGASKGASHALKVVAEQAATASAKLAR